MHGVETLDREYMHICLLSLGLRRALGLRVPSTFTRAGVERRPSVCGAPFASTVAVANGVLVSIALAASRNASICVTSPSEASAQAGKHAA
jgi:hypothetical protein